MDNIKYLTKKIVNKLILIVNHYKFLKKIEVWILKFFPKIRNRLALYMERNHLIEKGWCQLISGFGTNEGLGCWSVTNRAVILVLFKSNFFKRTILSVEGLLLSDEYRAEIILNGKKITEWKNGVPFLVTIPDEICSRGKGFELVINIQNILSPKDLGISDDSSMLGIFIKELKINNAKCEIADIIDLNKSAKYFYWLLRKNASYG